MSPQGLKMMVDNRFWILYGEHIVNPVVICHVFSKIS